MLLLLMLLLLHLCLVDLREQQAQNTLLVNKRQRRTSHVTRHTSHVTRHTSHVTLSAQLSSATSTLSPPSSVAGRCAAAEPEPEIPGKRRPL
jgi:hypothetical protein